MTAKDLFNEWTDVDVAEYYLACLLGIMSYDPEWEAFRKAKGVFWTGNKVGTALYNMLEEMVSAGILEKDEEECQYRRNGSFKGYWEGGTAGLS